MSYYLIGIGGTGARCMESFVHLCGAGLLKDSQDVKIIYVDADVSCGNLTRTQEAVNFYEKARRVGANGNEMFKNSLVSAGMWSPVEEDKENLDEIFNRSFLYARKEYIGLGHLYDALFTSQERSTNLDKGFRGHPAIGAAVMNQKMSPNDDPWKDLLPKIKSDKDAKIFLFASVFGGTGAAGFPTIARLLQSYLNKDENGKCMARIGGALVLPYFQFSTADEEEQQEMQAKVEEFMINTKSALDYYNKNHLLGDVFTSIYMVGDNDLSEIKSFSLGSSTQRNDAHIIEIFAALAAFDFFNKSEYDEATTPMIAREAKKIDDIVWGDLPNVCISGNLREKLANFVKYLYAYKTVVYPALKDCAKDERHKKKVSWYINLVEKNGSIDVYNNREIMDSFDALAAYTEKWFQWMEEISSNEKRSIELFNRLAYKENISTESYNLDVHQVVLPLTEKKKTNIWDCLCNAKPSDGKEGVSGTKILMSVLEAIVRK